MSRWHTTPLPLHTPDSIITQKHIDTSMKLHEFMGKHKGVEGILILHLTTMLRACSLDVKWLHDFNCRRSTPGCTDLKINIYHSEPDLATDLATYSSSTLTHRLKCIVSRITYTPYNNTTQLLKESGYTNYSWLALSPYQDFEGQQEKKLVVPSKNISKRREIDDVGGAPIVPVRTTARISNILCFVIPSSFRHYWKIKQKTVWELGRE